MESIEAYHADYSHFGSTAIRLFQADPLAFYRTYIRCEPRTSDSRALAVGQAFHAEMSGTYDAEFAVKPQGLDRRTTVGKAQWAEFEQFCGDRTIIDFDEFVLVMSMAEAVKTHPHAAWLANLDDGRNEVSYRWQDDGGLPLKVRFDRILDDGTIIEYKTIDAFGASALSTFARACQARRYDMQAAMYCRGRDQMTLGTGGDFYFVVVTKTIPSQCMLVRPRESFLARGMASLNQAIKSLGTAIAKETLDPGPHNWVLPHFTEVMELA